MNCATVKEWMPHYIDGQLSPEAQQAIYLHTLTCPGCAEWLEEARELLNDAIAKAERAEAEIAA